MLDKKIALVNEHKDKVKKEYTIDNTKVKVIGVGFKSIKVLALEPSKFTKFPCWKQHWIKFATDLEKESSKLLLKAMIDSI